MSQKKSLAELKVKRKAARRANRMALFGTTAPSPQRDELLARWQRIVAAFDANDPEELLVFLKEQRRGWTLEHDGKSALCEFIDNLRTVVAS